MKIKTTYKQLFKIIAVYICQYWLFYICFLYHLYQKTRKK